MIEFLNARRMILVIVVLILLCIIIVILEETITDNVDRPTPYFDLQKMKLNITNEHPFKKKDEVKQKEKNELNVNDKKTKCWESEPIVIEKHCSKCLNNELKLPYCSTTGYKELVRCKITGVVYRNCTHQDHLDQNQQRLSSLFYIFEFFMLCISIVFINFVHSRQNYLNKMILDRIEEQIASGV